MLDELSDMTLLLRVHREENFSVVEFCVYKKSNNRPKDAERYVGEQQS